MARAIGVLATRRWRKEEPVPVADSTRTNAVSPGAIVGASLEHHASVRAALAEGFALAAVLEVERIDGRAWEEIDAGWTARIVEDRRTGGQMFAAYEAALAQAEERLSRRVHPLDDDLGAWVAFLQAFSGDGDPVALLRKLGLGPNDIARLSRRWARKLASCSELRSRSAELRARPLSLPRITATPAALRPSPFAAGRAAGAPVRAAAQRESASDLPDLRLPERAIDRPQIQVPAYLLAARATGAHAASAPSRGAESPEEETLWDDSVPAGEPLPFRSVAAGAPPPAPAQVELTLEQYASLCVELRTHRGREIQTLLRYRLGAPRKAALDLQWREHFERSPGLRMAFTAACERYAAFLTGGKVASC